MSQTTINVRMDENLKKQFEDFCNEVGMNISVAVNIFAKTVVREKQIPFRITTDPFYSPENVRHLQKSIENLDAGRGVEHEIIEGE